MRVCVRERGKENVINLLVFSPKGLPRWCSVKNLPANAGDTRHWVQFLDWEDPLEEETATHSSILAWKIPWTKEPGGL